MASYQEFKRVFRQSIKTVSNYYEANIHSSSGRFPKWFATIRKFDSFVKSVDNTDTMKWMQNCKLADGSLFGDWFVNVPEAIQLGFLKSFISYNVWKYTDDFDDYIRDGYMPIVMSNSNPAYMSAPKDFRMFLDSDYFGRESLDAILRNALYTDNNNIIDHAYSYINTNDDIVFVSQPYSAAVGLSLSEIHNLVNIEMQDFNAIASVQYSEKSEYSPNCVALTFVISFL